MREWGSFVAMIAKTARTAGQATSLGPPHDFAFSPLSTEQFEREERRLGLRLPLLVKLLYTEVGNGGFGPGHGLLSLSPLSADDHPIYDLYEKFHTSPDKSWAESVVPFSHWGCMIFSCLDLAGNPGDPPVLRFEPNMSREDTLSFLKNVPFRGTGIIPESDRLSLWLEDWLSGKEMFERPYSDA